MLLVIVFLCAALLWTAPADLAWRVLSPRLPGWQAQGLDGTLWQGRAERVALHGVELGALEWNVSRGAFFSGTTRGSASLRGEGIAVDLGFSRRDNVASLRDVRLAMPAAWLAPAMALPGLVPHGQIDAQLRELEIRDGYLANATGSFVWRGVGVAGAAEGSIGDIEAEFVDAPAEGGVLLRVRDRNAQLGVDGSVHFRGSAFELEVRLTPRQQSLQIFEVLKLIGQRTPDGGTLLRVSGQMRPLF